MKPTTPPPTRFQDLPDLMTVNEAAAFLRMKPATLYESIRLGLVPAVRPSPRRIRLSRSALQNWAEGKRSA